MYEEKIISKFRSYQWGELWSLVKDATLEDLKKSSHKNFLEMALAFKSLLLANNWQLKELSYEILSVLPVYTKNPYVAFARYYTYLIFADKAKMEQAKRAFPSNTYTWMVDWINLEYAARSLNFSTLKKELIKLSKGGNPLPQFAMVALLQTCDNENAKIDEIIKSINDNEIRLDNTPLAFSIMKMIGKDTQETHQLIECESYNYLCAQKYYEKSDITNSLKAFDRLALQESMTLETQNKWLLLTLCSRVGFADFEKRAGHALKICPNQNEIQGLIASRLLVYYWITREYAKAFGIVNKFNEFNKIESNEKNKIAKIFYNYTLKLCVAWERQNEKYQDNLTNKTLHVLGESHSLSPSNRVFKMGDYIYQAKTRIVWGVKMFHLGSAEMSIYRALFEDWLKAIPKNEALLITVGEIDFRPNEGVWKAVNETGVPIRTILDKTIDKYTEYLKIVLSNRCEKTYIQGIPAPAYPVNNKNCKNPSEFLKMIEIGNELLKINCINNGWIFVDVYKATCDTNTKMSNLRYHIDQNHIAPRFYDEINSYIVE